jgi:chitodextrinase
MNVMKNSDPHFLRRPSTALWLGGLLWINALFVVQSALIPPNQLVSWVPGSTVGVPGGIPSNRTTIIDVTKAPYNADNTGASDATAAIQTAINAATSGSVVYLPAGTYLVKSSIAISQSRNNFTVRGSGTNTVIQWTGATGAFISVGCASDYGWTWPASGNSITAGTTQGSTNLTMADTSAFSAGQMVHIVCNNDGNLPVVHVSGFAGLRRQKSRVMAKTATTLSIFPPLYFDTTGLAPKAFVAQLQTSGVGIEDMYVNAANSTSPYIFEFEQCVGCWIKNVHSFAANNYHVFLYDSLQCEVRHCNLDTLNHVGSNGAGVLCNTSSGCLVEDNIIYKAFPIIEVNQGSSGNVFAYNFLYDSSSFGNEGAAIDSNHGPHNCFNLYEGNSTPNLQSDGYFGSASHDVIFRNWLNGITPGNTSPGWTLSLNRFTRYYSLVGNIIGAPGYTWAYDGTSCGNPNMGNSSYAGFAPPWADWGTSPGPAGFQEKDTNVMLTLNRQGNYNYYNKAIPATEALGSNVLPASLYLAAKPVWFGNLAWPPFDPTNPNPTLDAIPAGYRYVHGVDPPGVNSTDSTPPTVPTALAAIAAGASQINLSWAASSDNVGVTGYLVERSQGSGSTTYIQVGTAAGTSFADAGLLAGTVYNYRVRATDAAVNLSGYSSVATATTTTTADTTAPTTPTALTAIAAGTSQINVTWTASTDNTGVTGYRVERSQGAGSTSFTQVGTPAGASFADAGLSPATVYNYRVRATDAAGNVSGYSTVATATTATGSDSTPPTAPTALAAAAAGASQINLTWTASTDNVGVTGYRIERSQGAGSTTFVQVGTPVGASFSDVGLSAVTTYNYRVRATDAAGNLSSYSVVATATTATQTSSGAGGLVAAYGFNEGAGATTVDLSGNGNTGLIINATWTTAGKYGNGLVFSGVNTWVAIADAPSMHLTTGMTIEAWVKPSVVENRWREVFYKGDAYGNDLLYLEAMTTSGAVPAIGTQLTSGGSIVATGTTPLTANAWAHMAATYDGATLRLFVNGVQVASQAQTGTLLTSTQSLTIGADSIHGSFFQGTIDEVRVYNRALSASELQSDMSTPLGTIVPAAPQGLRVVVGSTGN